MGLFKGLKKVFNPGGAVISKVIGDGRDYQGVLDYAMHGQDQAKKNQEAQKALQTPYTPKPPYSPAPGGVSSYPAMRLGWTNGGYNYSNSPFNSPQQPMSFAPMNRGIMTPSGPQMMLPSPSPNGNMPPAGAQPMPTAPRDPRVDLLRQPRAIM